MPCHETVVFFAMMVIPRPFEIARVMTRSSTTAFERKTPVCRSMASTNVVLPWSTCAMMAMLRTFSRRSGIIDPSCGFILIQSIGALRNHRREFQRLRGCGTVEVCALARRN
jgi:hypothetical protein